MDWTKLSSSICYLPPLNSSHVCDDDIFFILSVNVAELGELHHHDYISLIGSDFNARTNIKADYVTNDVSEHVPVPNSHAEDDATVTQENADTKPFNANGASLLQFCKATGCWILNGRMGVSTGVYTCFTSKGSSVVDYMLCRPCNFKHICHFAISEANVLSDHCALHVTLKSPWCHGQSYNAGDQNCA